MLIVCRFLDDDDNYSITKVAQSNDWKYFQGSSSCSVVEDVHSLDCRESKVYGESVSTESEIMSEKNSCK